MPQSDAKNSSAQEQQQAYQVVQYPQHYEDNTIDLYKIWNSIWNGKWLVIAFTVVAALGSILYALQLKHIYKAQALILKPNAKDFQSMNLRGIQIALAKKSGINILTDLKSNDIFNKFKQNIKLRSIQKKFIKEKGLMELLTYERKLETSDEEIYKGFAEMIKLEEENEIYSISIDSHDAEIASEWVNDLIEFVSRETISMLMEDLRNSIDNQIREIEYNISSKRMVAEKRREDQIIRYTEHAEIAKKLGMIGRDVRQRIQSTQMDVDIASVTTPLYYLGYEALMTEIEILRNRKSDDPFIPGLRDLQEQLALLRSVNLDQKKMTAVHIDQAAYPPRYPYKPNRKLIVALATLFGLFSGIFFTLFFEFVRYQREIHSD